MTDLALCPACGYRVGQIEQRDAENERLRAEVEQLSAPTAFVSAPEQALAYWEWSQAEIKRLQFENGSLARMSALTEDMLRARTERFNQIEAEIERLQGQLLNREASGEWLMAEVERLRAENTRLRAALTAIRNICRERSEAGERGDWDGLALEAEIGLANHKSGLKLA